jgi:hypothetical protein
MHRMRPAANDVVTTSHSLQLVLPILRDELIHLEEAVRPLLAEKTRYRAPKRLFDLARQLPHLLEVAHASASAEQIVEGGAAFLEAVQSVVADLGTEQTTLSQVRAHCSVARELIAAERSTVHERPRYAPSMLRDFGRLARPAWTLPR